MSFDDLLIHTLVVKRLTDAGGTDDYGQPVTPETTFATVKGRIEPKTASEVALLSQGGAVVSSHVGYIWPLAGLTTADWIESGDVRYDITGMPDGGGAGHHLELELRAVV